MDPFPVLLAVRYHKRNGAGGARDEHGTGNDQNAHPFSRMKWFREKNE